MKFEKSRETDLAIFQINPIFSHEEDLDGELGTVEDIKVKRPSRYKVLLHNDDYTTMEFVIFILQTVFGKTFEEAKVVMLNVHNNGTGICGIYTHEIAETKAAKVENLAKENGHPLMCTIEPES
jgi:ATP-dependent Clp protease adaptor protein ClpS